MARKLFVVSRDHPELLESLRRAVAGERDVEVIYDRRLAGKAASREQVERRVGPDIGPQLRQRGFAVVHLAPRAAQSFRSHATPSRRFRF